MTTTNFQWDKELRKILNDWKETNDFDMKDPEPLDGDEVDALTDIIRAKLNYLEGNITEDEYLSGETG